MRRAVKHAVRLQAWRLGAGSRKEKELMAAGRIRLRPDGTYELFSQEATGAVGQIAQAGDYFKEDPPGCPYPNKRAFFEATHTRVGGNWYIQQSPPIRIWTVGEPLDEAVEFLLRTGRLEIRPDDPEKCFSAELWGTRETAARDAVLAFYEIKRDGNGSITDVTFNFIARPAFEKTYTVLDGETPESGAEEDGR